MQSPTVSRQLFFSKDLGFGVPFCSEQGSPDFTWHIAHIPCSVVSGVARGHPPGLGAPAPSLAQAALPNSWGLGRDNLAFTGCVFGKAGHATRAKPAPVKLVRDKWVFSLSGKVLFGGESPGAAIAGAQRRLPPSQGTQLGMRIVSGKPGLRWSCEVGKVEGRARRCRCQPAGGRGCRASLRVPCNAPAP